ncbi:MAG TPA: lysylphosphatidylglycerol synthase transmembrane domain-containing protein [Aggregatilineales bacterium]|nr:lysylphosphatidylglycerol synthase transmembrane domain-containing protein [Aggregatilineales bacterium]
MKRWQSLLLGIVVSVITLVIALYGTDLSRLGGVLTTGHYLWIVPMLALIVLGLYLRALRWRVLLNDGIERQHSFNILNASYLFNNLLPLRAGEVVRVYLATRLTSPVPILTSGSSIVVERLTDLLSMGVLVALALVVAPTPPDMPREIIAAVRGGAVIGILGAVLLVLIASRRSLAHRLLDMLLKRLPALERLNLRALVDNVLDGIAPLASGKGLAQVILWTALAWAVSVIQTYILLYVFYPQPTWDAALLMVPISSLAVALPALPASVGPFEFAMTTAIRISSLDPGKDATRALAAGVVLHIAVTAMYAFMGVLSVSAEHITIQEILRSAQTFAGNLRRRDARTPEPIPGRDARPLNRR